MDPRIPFKAGIVVGALGFVLSVIMMVVASGAAAAPWQIGALGFAATGLVAGAGLWISRRRR
jgi:hypothetical protein